MGPALSLHEKALRLSLLELELRPEVERFELRLLVRVAIESSLSSLEVSTVGEEAPFPS